MEIIHENEYVYKMNDEIEPYLATHRQEGYIPEMCIRDRLAQKKNCAPICVAGVKYKILRLLCKILPCTLRGKIVGSIYAK